MSCCCNAANTQSAFAASGEGRSFCASSAMMILASIAAAMLVSFYAVVVSLRLCLILAIIGIIGIIILSVLGVDLFPPRRKA